MAPAFPLAKLASILLKQISKPLANRLKRQAKSSHFFRTWICMPPAQLYHWVEVNVKMRMLNLGKPVDVPKLNEAMAIELGAELLGEGVVFLVASGCILAEYMRGLRNAKLVEAAKEGRADDIENRVYELEYIVSEQEARIRELSRLLYVEKKIKLPPPTKPKKPPPPPSSSNEASPGSNSVPVESSKRSPSLVERAIEDVKSVVVLL